MSCLTGTVEQELTISHALDFHDGVQAPTCQYRLVQCSSGTDQLLQLRYGRDAVCPPPSHWLELFADESANGKVSGTSSTTSGPLRSVLNPSSPAMAPERSSGSRCPGRTAGVRDSSRSLKIGKSISVSPLYFHQHIVLTRQTSPDSTSTRPTLTSNPMRTYRRSSKLASRQSMSDSVRSSWRTLRR